MADLKSLVQTGSLQDYLEEFDVLSHKVTLTEEYSLSCFLSGLRDEIKIPLRMFGPRSLQQAYALARLQESYLTATRSNRNYYNKPPSQPPSTTTTTQSTNSKPPLLPTPSTPSRLNPYNIAATASKPPFNVVPNHKPFQPRTRRLTDEEINEKRAKNLCFWCDEKFVPGHQCRKKQLHMIVVQDFPEMEENTEVAVDSFSGDGENTTHVPNISLHAMGGLAEKSHQTMRVLGQYKRKALHILIDSGSTHNFLDQSVIKGLGYQLLPIDPVPITIANGQEVWCTQVCKRFTWEVQSYQFTADFLVMPLGGCEMVLGIQWLATLGDIVWNFNSLRMSFTTDAGSCVIQGITTTRIKLVSGTNLLKMMQSTPYTAYALQVCTKMSTTTPNTHVFTGGSQFSIQAMGVNDLDLTSLLTEFQSLFDTPQTLPPHRLHDHRIPLVEGAKPVNVRPYNHSPLQKDVIE